MQKAIKLSRSQRGCVRNILSRINRAARPKHFSNKTRSELRTAVVRELLEGIKADAIIKSHSPKPVQRRGVAVNNFCSVCQRLTKFRGGECQEHEVKYCSICHEMTPRTPNDKCAKHVNQWCGECRAYRAFVNGKCVDSHLHAPSPSAPKPGSIWSTFWG